ncbi:MAG: alpha/beta fold hydrolase [Nitriliruptoraceae bacterium]
MWTRRSRIAAWLLWFGTRVASPVSSRVAGRLAAVLWTIPWQFGARRRVNRPTATGRTAGLVPLEVVDVSVFRRDRGVTRTQRVHLWAVGEGPTALLVHGWSDDARTFGPLARELGEQGWRAVVCELPAHGSSRGVRTDGLQVAQVIRHVAEHCDARVVVSHSLGAFATMIALADGLRVDAAALLAPVVRLADAVDTFVARVSLPDRAARALRRHIERRYGPTLWEELVLDRRAVSFDMPALVVHDPDDRQAPIASARALAATWPNARLMETEGLGHRRIVDDEAVMRRVVAFVTSVERAGRPDDDRVDGEPG